MRSTVRGRLLALETAQPLEGYAVEVYDEDIVANDLLASGAVSADGRFEFQFDESVFKDSAALDIEGQPEITLRVATSAGEEVGEVGIVRGTHVDFGDVFVSRSGNPIAPALDPEAAAICPGCGAMYRAGFSTCADCGVTLRGLG